ncbi:MAG: Spy/CpxP family protein refolding chaperone [Stellaceae bacterium]
MRRHLVARVAPALLAAFLLPAGALAQTSSSAPAGPHTAAPSTATPQNEAAAPGPRSGSAALQRINRRIAGLRAKLHITTAEEPQWHQFAEVMRDNARQIAPQFAEREKNFRSMNAVENMKSYAGIAERHAKNMESLVPAFEDLYNSLSAEQKHVADQLWRSYAERAHHRHKG